MIGRLSGTLLEKNPPQILLDVQGVGYEVDVPMSTFYNLPALNEKVVLHTQLIVREDAHLLFGFLTHEERVAFRQLLKISGVGPKLAVRLTRIPGVGKKTAERLLLELQGKFAPSGAAGGGGAVMASAGNDIVNALLALGYNEKEADWAAKQLPKDANVSDGIRQALKLLSKA